MPRKEKLGKLVLLEEIGADHVAVSYLAARLGPDGLDRIVTLLRYSEAVSNHTEARARLMEKARQTARLPIPGLLRVLGIGRADQSCYTSYELMEGRTVRAVIDRARQEGFPFAADNALMVASRAAVVLEALHARKDEVGTPLYHGLLKPSHLIISWEGEVKLTGLGLWAGLRDTGLMGEDEERYLAPEQSAGGQPGDSRSDLYALALVLLEMLSGRRPDGPDPLATLSAARHTTATGEEEAIPKPIEEILRLALAPEPSRRFPGIAEMRRAIDTLLFSGDFTPTTFNLAFFMHSLFREDMERESATLEEASQADYSEYLPAPGSPASESGAEAGMLDEADAPATAPAEAEPRPPVSRPEPRPSTEPGLAGSDSAPGDSSGSGRRRPGSGTRATRAREGSLRFARATAPRRGGRRLALVVGLVLAVGAGGSLGALYWARKDLYFFQRTPSPPTLSPDAAAALARVRELEARLADLEHENAEMAAEAETRGRQEAAVASPAPDPLAEQRAAEGARAESRRRAQARQARREAEIRELERELRGAEQRLVAEQQVTHEALQEDMLQATLPAVSTPPPTPKPLPPPVRPGDLIDSTDPGLTLPRFVSGRPVSYPPAAQRFQRTGTVQVEALVDEKGMVAEARVRESSTPGLGFEDAALRQVRTRRYEPGTKNGVPVRVWIVVRVNFTL